MRLGLRLGSNRQGASEPAAPAEPAPTQAETTALLASMTVQPEATRATKINELIYALKQAGVWTKMPRFYVTHAHTEQAATLDWKRAGIDLQKYGTVAFTADYGFVSNGVGGSYLLSDYIPSTDGGMTAGSGHLGVLVDHLNNAGAGADIGILNTSNRIVARNPPFGLVHGTGVASGPAPASTLQHACVSRTAFDLITGYTDGVAGTPGTAAITPALPSGNLTLCANNSSATPSVRVLKAAHIGSGLTGTEVAAINTALKAYLA